MKFDKPVALNRDTHGQWRFRPIDDFGFAAGLHSAPLCVSEFFAAAKEYAIVFVRSESGEPFPMVVLGLKQDENLFLSGDGRWQARYLPVSLRSYPFAYIASTDSGVLQIVIDEAYPGFSDKEGNALFGESGEPAPELAGKLKFLQAHHHDVTLTRRLGSELHRLGLLTERSAQLQVSDDTNFRLNGFWIVDEAKLNALDDANLLGLARNGHLALITAHLLSISNLALLGPKLKHSGRVEARAASPQPKTKTKAKVHAKD